MNVMEHTFRQDTMAGIRKQWTDGMLEHFIAVYPFISNPELARWGEVSERTILRKAKDLGLTKDKYFRISLEGYTYLLEMHGKCPFGQIAQKAKTSRRTIIRISKYLNLKLDEKQKKKLISNGIVKMLRSENRKLIFGLETTSNRPIGRDRSRHEAAQLLKECGYVVIKGSMTAYYNDEMDRYSDVEQLAVANGFRLELWP